MGQRVTVITRPPPVFVRLGPVGLCCPPVRTQITTAAALSLLLMAGLALAGPTYRWVDADGVHYSDQPHVGAEKIFLGQTQTYSSSDNPVSSANPTTSSGRKTRGSRDDAEFHYDSCAVVQPTQEQVFVEVESVTVAVQVRPAKRSSDRVVLVVDGVKMDPRTPDQTEFHLTPIERGTHTVVATIRDSGGKDLCQSTSVSFSVRQPSVLAPLNPNRHR